MATMNSCDAEGEPVEPESGTSVDALHAHPRPWKYNPSRWGERLIIAGLAMAATLISGYMALFQFGVIDRIWDPFFGPSTEAILTSDVAKELERLFRIPDAALGSIGYLADVILVLAGSTRRWQFRPWLIATFGIAVIPVGAVSFTLVAVQGLVLNMWCTPCLITALLSLALMILASDEVISSFLYMKRLAREANSKREVWDAFWGRPTSLAWSVGESMTRAS